jgi:hypothetical protein
MIESEQAKCDRIQPTTPSTNAIATERQTTITMGKAANDGFPYQGDNDCDRPACDDMMTKLKRAAQAAAAESSTTTKTKKKAPSPSVVECPLGSAELGRSSWGLLHSMVSCYSVVARTQKQGALQNEVVVGLTFIIITLFC